MGKQGKEGKGEKGKREIFLPLFLFLIFCFIGSELFAQTPTYTRRTHPGSTQPEHMYGYRPYGDDRTGMLVGGLRQNASPLPNLHNQYDETKEGEPIPPHSLELPAVLQGPDFWTSPEGMVSTLQIMLVLTVLTLAPAIILMTTSFVRLIVVLSILRQALGTGQLPPSQVITALSLFITLLLMAPAWQKVYREAVLPYTERRISLDEAFTKAERPIREFMCRQIEKTGNFEDVWLFMRYVKDVPAPKEWKDVPWRALLPAFMLSELKTAFLIGFMIFLPFLILDMIIASVMVSMGMMMLPPVMISLPFKLMLFVLMDGWNLVVMALMESFAL